MYQKQELYLQLEDFSFQSATYNYINNTIKKWSFSINSLGRNCVAMEWLGEYLIILFTDHCTW